MIEKRSSERKAVHGDIQGGCVFIEPTEVQDLSLSGIRFKSTRKIDPNTTQTITMRYNGDRLHLQGKVIRSAITHSRVIEGFTVPIYEVAIHFGPTSEEQQNGLRSVFHGL